MGIAGTIGVVLYFVLAVGQHLRKKDVKGMPPAGTLVALAVVALVLRLGSL